MDTTSPSTSSTMGSLKAMEIKLKGMRDDTTTIPMFLNTSKGQDDKAWMVPSTIFHTKCLGDAIEELWYFEEALIKEGGVRQATQAEMGWLFKHYYLPWGHQHLLLAPFMDLVVVCKDLDHYKEIEGLVTSMISKSPSISQGDAIHGIDTFPSFIPKCTLTNEEMKANYSLTSTKHNLKGSLWAHQVGALKAFKTEPPISTYANVTKVKPTTLEIMIKQLDGYIGFCNAHLKKEASMDLVMEPSSFAHYVAFLEVSGAMACQVVARGCEVWWY